MAPPGSLYTVPGEVDPALAGALGIAGLAGWMPVAHRAPVRAGETVLVLGATGTAGAVALQGAKLLGAGRVVAAGRDPDALARASELGADAIVRLDDAGDRRPVRGGRGTAAVAPRTGEAARDPGLFALRDSTRRPRGGIHRLVGHASSGAIRLPIERIGLDRIGEAWRRQAGGPHAKIVVVP